MSIINDFMIFVEWLKNEPVHTMGYTDKNEHWAVREGYKVESKPRETVAVPNHIMEDLPSFAAWVSRRFECARTDILLSRHDNEIRAEATMVSETGLDVETPACRAVVQLHPRAGRWFSLFGGRMVAQSWLYNHVLAAYDDFPVPVSQDEGGLVYSLGDTLANQLQKLSVKREANLECEMGPNGSIRFTGHSDGREVSGTLPQEFRIHVPLWTGSERLYELDVRLRMHIAENARVVFELVCPNLEVVLHQSLVDAAEDVREMMGEGWLVLVGRTDLRREPV